VTLVRRSFIQDGKGASSWGTHPPRCADHLLMLTFPSDLQNIFDATGLVDANTKGQDGVLEQHLLGKVRR